MAYPNPSQCPSLQTAKGWIHLRRLSDHTVDLPDALLCPAQGYGARPARGLLRSYQAIRRPPPTAADGRAMQSVSLSFGDAQINLALNKLAGGMPEELSMSVGELGAGIDYLNHYTSYLRGIQRNLDFTRNGKTCKARTGGSRYSGKQGVHTQWDYHFGQPRPTKPMGTIAEPMTVHTAMEKQGAYCEKIETAPGVITITTIPIEVDPDGWGGGSDHGIEENVGTDLTQPEALLPVLYTGLRVVTRIETTAVGGVFKITHTIQCRNRHGQVPADLAVTGAWRWSPLRVHLAGGVRDVYAVNAGAGTNELGTETLGLGPETYEDVGSEYEMNLNDTLRDGISFGDTLVNSAELGIVKTDAAGPAVGLFSIAGPTATLASGAAQALTSTTSLLWADRTDLPGDPVAGSKHHFLGIAYDISNPATIPATVTSTTYLIVGETAANVVTRYGLLVS